MWFSYVLENALFVVLIYVFTKLNMYIGNVKSGSEVTLEGWTEH